MANGVKWIKLTVDFFDDEKILLIMSMPNGHIITIVWIMLLCLAGKQNNSGVFKFNNGVPYTDKMLATIFRMDEAMVSLALDTFVSFGMIQIVGGVITITNWGKHQNLDKIEEHNEYMRNYMRTYRAKQKAIAIGEKQSKLKSKPNSKPKIREADEEINKEQDIKVDTDIDIDTDINADTDYKNLSSLDYDSIIKSFNSICKSLPKVTKLTDKRKKAMQTAFEVLDGVSFENFFEKIENSDFLAGRVKDWQADFDWILIPEKTTMILSGKYDNRKSNATINYSDTKRYKNMKMED